MFKRSTKITSLLVAAASVASMVPAYAADYKRVDSKDGQVYHAQAFKDGVAVIDGDAKDNDTDAVYYLKDGKYTELDQLNTGDDFGDVVNGKYLDIADGDNFVDLTTGKVTDDDILGDNKDEAAANLKKKIKADNDGRYLKSDSDTTKESSDLNVVPGARYGETWYSTTYNAKNTTDAQVSAYNVYTDGTGKYIDADYNIGKIKVTSADGSVTLKNTNSDKLQDEDDSKATINQVDKIIGQDKDYIYRKVEMKVTLTSGAITEINGADCTTSSAVFTRSTDGKEVTFNAIQKISKAQASDEVDGAKYAKTAETYIISKDDATAYTDSKSTLLTDTDTEYTIADGKVIVYNKGLHEVATMTLKSKSSYYYTDLASIADDNVTELTTDVDGNLWMLNDGFVYEFDNDEDWNKMYKVDGSMSHLSVYDKDNIVLWSDDSNDDKVYSVVGGKTKSTDTTDTTGTTGTTTTTTTTAAAGWVQNTTDGTWTYVNTDGTKKTGWFQDTNATWYYLGVDGTMKTGWFQDTTGTWYYADQSGAMLHDTTVGGYTLGSNGAWVQ